MRQAVFDIEADALDVKDVTNVWCICLKEIGAKEVKKYGPNDIRKAVEELDNYDNVIGHNILIYDLPVLGKFFNYSCRGQVIDTLVLSRLANPDRRMPFGMNGKWIPHSIAAWAIRLGMQHKIEHEDWSQFSEQMMNRCEHDVIINEAVYKALYQEFKE